MTRTVGLRETWRPAVGACGYAPSMSRVHIDTDFAGDPDDACALAMILGWPGAEITGITTTADPDGMRAGYVRHFLRLAGRPDIPVAVGAGHSLTTGLTMGDVPDHHRYWGDDPVAPEPIVAGAATMLLEQSIAVGATIAAIGPYTNLALLGGRQLAAATVVTMGGWIQPAADGLPPWGPESDWNTWCDTQAAATVANHAGDLTWSLLPVTMPAHLRGIDLPRLRATGSIGDLLARQSAAHAQDQEHLQAARRYPGLPDDLVNFHWDPLACAVALGWSGATVEPARLVPVIRNDAFQLVRDRAGRSMQVLTGVDGDAFTDTWITHVAAAQAGDQRR